MKCLSALSALVFSMILAGCGGGGGSAGTSVFSGSGSGSSSDSSGSTSESSDSVASTASGTVVLSLSSKTTSASNPSVVTALVKDASGSPIKDVVVTFKVTGSKAKPSVDSVLTDANGQASVTLPPSSSTVEGADYVSATAELSTATSLSTRMAFSVSPTSVTLSSVRSDSSSVAAYGSAVLTADVNGASSSSPVMLVFTSTCASAGKATISPTSVSVTGASGSVTYQDKGCGATDKVSASISGTSQLASIDLGVQSPTALALEYDSATPEKICIAGSGCEGTSTVKFRLKDQAGNPQAGKTVTFVLDVPNVATLSVNSSATDVDGYASVAVKSGLVPSPVRVRATYAPSSGTALTTVSNQLAINAGLPTQDAISFSSSTYNIDGMETDGTRATIRAQLNDRFGNPVPDGTSISFVSEGASVIPGRCTTVSGVCQVEFVSSNFRPADGRVTVVAFAQGEESFADTNGDHMYTSGESFVDLGSVFVDKNENNTMDSTEYLVGQAADGAWSGNNYVRRAKTFVLSSSGTVPRLFAASVDSSGNRVCGTTVLASLIMQPTTASCRVTQYVCVKDGTSAADARGGNPIPAGATLSASTKAKGATVSVDMSTIPSNMTDPTIHMLKAELSDCATALQAAGPIDLTVKMPAGQTYTYEIGLIQ